MIDWNDVASRDDLRADAGRKDVLWIEIEAGAVDPPTLERLKNEFGFNERQGQLEQKQIACFSGRRHVVVIHHGADRTVEAVRGRLEEETDHPHYVLMDEVVDDWERIAHEMELEVERPKERALQMAAAPIGQSTGEHTDQSRLYKIKQYSARIRRFALPLGKGFDVLMHHDRGGWIRKNGNGGDILRDIHDHVLRLGSDSGDSNADSRCLRHELSVGHEQHPDGFLDDLDNDGDLKRSLIRLFQVTALDLEFVRTNWIRIRTPSRKEGQRCPQGKNCWIP